MLEQSVFSLLLNDFFDRLWSVSYSKSLLIVLKDMGEYDSLFKLQVSSHGYDLQWFLSEFCVQTVFIDFLHTFMC